MCEYHIIPCIHYLGEYLMFRSVSPKSYLDREGTMHVFYRHHELLARQSFVRDGKCCEKVADHLYLSITGASHRICRKYVNEAHYRVISREKVLAMTMSMCEIRWWSK